MSSTADHLGDDTTTEEHDHEPRGTLAITLMFLAMCVFMFGWAYWLLIYRG
jgi:hypothetical protein